MYNNDNNNKDIYKTSNTNLLAWGFLRINHLNKKTWHIMLIFLSNYSTSLNGISDSIICSTFSRSNQGIRWFTPKLSEKYDHKALVSSGLGIIIIIIKLRTLGNLETTCRLLTAHVCWNCFQLLIVQCIIWYTCAIVWHSHVNDWWNSQSLSKHYKHNNHISGSQTTPSCSSISSALA